jgi:acyl-coenzyme A synthetase/AMP-(fatty) acid ligase
VAECAVIAIPDPLVTNRIAAFVVAADLAVDELLGFAGERLPSYMLPEQVDFVPGLPKTSTGKVDRRALAGAE